MGTMRFANAVRYSTMMRDKTLWGEDANEFDPNRWMKEGSSELDRYYMPVSNA